LSNKRVRLEVVVSGNSAYFQRGLPMYKSHSVPTLEAYSLDGREFVTIDDFLTTFPKATGTAKENFRELMDMMMNTTVEKRMDKSFMKGLTNRCLSVRGRNSMHSPTVTADGWVFWTSAYHNKLIGCLTALYIGENSAVDWEFFKHNLGWTISTMDCKSIMLPEGYKPCREDTKIFELFSVHKM